MPPSPNLIGQQFDRLTVVEKLATRMRGCVWWKCLCTCGAYTEVTTALLRNGNTRSCGCIHKKHGQTSTRLFKMWDAIKQRTQNPNCPAFKDYGGRGITMHPRWINDFKAFRDYVMALPDFDAKLLENANGCTNRINVEIDRKDNDCGYRPGNLRWSTRREQMLNTRKTLYVTLDGIGTMTVQEACELTRLPYHGVQNFRKCGGTAKQFFELYWQIPVRRYRPRSRKVTK
jgi:hypothetical protein